MCSCSLDLIGVVVQTDDITSRKRCDFSGGFANTTANVEDSHRLIDLNSMSEVVFMARESLQ